VVKKSIKPICQFIVINRIKSKLIIYSTILIAEMDTLIHSAPELFHDLKNMKVYLTAMIKSTEGNADQMKELIKDLVAASKKESACLQYELFQSIEEETQFIIHETWKDQDKLDEHNKSAHLDTFVQQSQFFLDGKIVVYKTNKV
jgi:quinol monooxygenase YgiN